MTYRLGALLVVVACAESPAEPSLIGTLTIEPAAVTLDIGFTQEFSGVLLDSTGAVLAAPDSVHWVSWDTTVVTIMWNGGVATARGPGVGRIQARWQHLRDTVEVTVRPLEFASVSPGYGIACALTQSHRGYCWGENDAGQLGDGTTDWHAKPGVVAGELDFAAIRGYHDHACGVTLAGEAYCWGANTAGELGDGTDTLSHRYVPTRVSGSVGFATISVGGGTCALTPSGRAYCWGGNATGRVGDGTTTTRYVPVPVSGDHTFALLSAGSNPVCALTVDGTAYCWGDNRDGEVGDGTLINRPVPTPVAGGLVFQSVSAGRAHTCGVTVDDVAYCWGNNSLGELGDGTHADRVVPTPVSGGLTYDVVRPGGSHTCGLTTEGAAYCWGYNLVGELGQPFAELHDSPVPVPVTGGHTFTSLEAGNSHACGRATDGLFYCWGTNVFGQLGIGTLTVGSYEPVPVFGQRCFAGGRCSAAVRRVLQDARTPSAGSQPATLMTLLMALTRVRSLRCVTRERVGSQVGR